MSNFSDYTENNIITGLFRTGGFTKPAALYAALYTAMPGEAGGGTEVSGGSYARVQVGPSDATWAAPVSGDGHTENVGVVQFAAPTAAWGNIVGTALMDAAAAGNEIVYGALTTPKTVNNGDAAPSFAAGAFDFTVA